MMLLLNLMVAGVLVLVTCAVHFAGLLALSASMRHRKVHPVNISSTLGQGVSILGIVVALFALHSLQIWIYAFAYLALGEFTAMEPALYFSTSAFTTVGFGDLLLSQEWRMLGAEESANGFLLIGWSTAFLISVTARVRAFEAGIERAHD